jgi:DNA-binding GntR family transcriptional regulator
MTTPGTDGAAHSLAEGAYRALHELIVTCELEPGAWVSEAQLATHLGFGKTPTREALRRLSGDGLVIPAHRRGYQVTPITVAQAQQVFEAYRMFVPDVAVLVSRRATPEEKRWLADVAEDWAVGREATAHPGSTPFPLFVQLCRNPTIVEMGHRVIGHFERMVNFAIFHGALVGPEYLEILRSALRAIENGDEDAVRTGVGALVDATRDTVIGALLATPSLTTTPVAMVAAPR